MDEQSIELVRARALESRLQNQRVRDCLPRDGALSLRVTFARCAIDLACEHHSGLVRLADAGEYGTANALLRPLLEASTAAFWLMYVAQCETIKRLPITAVETHAEDLPSLDSMAKDLVPIFPQIQTLVDGFRRGGTSKWLHKYTHGGTPQLIRRGLGWSPAEVMLLLLRADLFGILAACLETAIAPNVSMGEYGFGRRDELAAELSERFNVPPNPSQLHELPRVLQDPCGPPLNF